MMLSPGDGFGDYTVVRLLGKGGMGAVFLLQAADGAEVAAKILDPASAGDKESRKRFLREAQLALGVKHPNLVETYDVGEDPDTGLCYILMEYVPGGSLSDRIKKGPVPVNEAISIVYQIASVLELARQKGVVHRDIKPDNIMFGADGKAKLADLGIARQGGATVTTVTQTGMMIGTPAYMAPEQMLDSHNVDTRADIYSLGIVFYEMLTGKRPNADDTVVQLMAKAVAGEPIPDVRTLRPEVSASLAELINLMCAMKADERVQTPADVTLALSQIVHGHEVTIRRKRPTAPVAKPAKQPSGDGARKLLAGFFVLLLVAGGVFAYLALQRHRSPVPAVPVAKPADRADERTLVAPSEARTVVREETNLVTRTVVATNVVNRVVEQESTHRVPAAQTPRRSYWNGQSADWRLVGPKRSETKNGLAWWYRLTEDGDAVLVRRLDANESKGAAGACVSPPPSGALDVPSRLDGRPVVGMDTGAFGGCAQLTSVRIPEGVVGLGSWAFAGCAELRDIRFPDSLRFIDRGAFLNCSQATAFDLNRVEIVAGGASIPPSCREFRVSELNPVYSILDGVLYAHDKTVLVRCLPTETMPSLPPTVTRLFDAAFIRLKTRNLVVPDQIREVGRDFVGPGIEEIRFGKGLVRLHKGAFWYCSPTLSRIIFEGDAPEVTAAWEMPGWNMFMPGDPQKGPQTRKDLTIYVHKASKGWNRLGETGLPKLWPTDVDPSCARPIRYIEDGILDVADVILSADRMPPLPSKTFNLPRRQTLELVGCPPGKFQMGHSRAPADRPIAKVHDVSFTRPFWIGRHPVTRAQWEAMNGRAERDLTPVEKALGGMKAPATDIALSDIREFCRNLTRRLKNGLPKGYVFRLPTDAEWEYAAFGGSSDQADPHVNDSVPDYVKSRFTVTYEEKLVRLKRAGLAVPREWQGYIGPVEVCTKKPNGWGIYDMLGNIDEWLLDTFPLTAPDGKIRKSMTPAADIGAYQALETDPLRYYDKSDAIGLVRSGMDGKYIHARRFFLSTVKGLPLGFRVVLGPDLEREKKTQKPAKKRK